MFTAAIKKIQIYLEMIKFEHSVFALPFAYLGLFLAENGIPRLSLFFWITVAMVSFRSMAMGANRLLDERIDALNPRTRERALPAGRLKRSFVWMVTVSFFALFEYSAYRLGPLCFALSPIPILLAWIYPLMKRFTWLSHFVLGIILGIAPYGAWLASRGEFSWIPGFLTLGVSVWVAGFDIIYALQDLEFDRRSGLHSFPARFGLETSLQAAKWLHSVTFGAWFMTGILAGLGVIFWVGLALVAALLIREHWLVRSSGLGKLQEAFFTMNAVISLLLFSVTVLDLSIGKGL